MMRAVVPVAILAITGSLAVYAYTMAGDYQRRDPQLTPGAIASRNLTEICQFGYARDHRVWPWPAGKKMVLQRYGILWRDAHLYEDDDLVPICLGGDNRDIRNHWPQLKAEAAIKDKAERAMCKMACAGKISLDEAQRYFLTWGQP